MDKDKWAFTYEIHRHVNDFVGPFDSHKDMMKALASLALDDETSMGDVIGDYLLSEETPEYIVESVARIRVFRVSEESINAQEVCDMWKQEIEKHSKWWKQQMEEQQERQDRKEYERLKKKFED